MAEIEGIAIDLTLPDEGVALAEVQVDATGVDAAVDVQAAMHAVARAQRASRIELLQRHGLSLQNHVLHDNGPLSADLLGALRIAMLSGAELRELSPDVDPRRNVISEESERLACEALRAILGGLDESVVGVGQQHVVEHCLRAVDEIESGLGRRAGSASRKRSQAEIVDEAVEEERRCLVRDLARVRHQQRALAKEEQRLQTKLLQFPSHPSSSTAMSASTCANDSSDAADKLLQVPWEVAAGSTDELLRELGLEKRYGKVFQQEGLLHAQQLLGLGLATEPSMPQALQRLGVASEDAEAIAKLVASPRPCGTSGGAWNERFLSAVRPAHDAHMGCENMGPLLYSLCRFIKPRNVLEVGAGYTSLWLLQALADNEEEMRRCRQSIQADGYLVSGSEWLLPWVSGQQSSREETKPDLGTERDEVNCEELPAVLHCVDDLSHEATTAHTVRAIAAHLGTGCYFKLHEVDAFEFAGQWQKLNGGKQVQLDLLWLDFGAGVSGRLDEFLEAWWPRLRPGGFLLIHSTLTNTLTRHWLEGMRTRSKRARDVEVEPSGDPCCGDDIETLSLLEPHKWYQNSVSLFQRRPCVPKWGEPVHTTFP